MTCEYDPVSWSRDCAFNFPSTIWGKLRPLQGFPEEKKEGSASISPIDFQYAKNPGYRPKQDFDSIFY